jgi:tRNA 2-selenouridine synthase
MSEEYLASYFRFPVIVDVRSEKEFAQGHIPGAVNIPVLDNHERHIVGTTYVQESSRAAVQLGIELFAKKAEAFLSAIAALGSKEFALYCWRGGMRSELPTLWLRGCGYKVHKLPGGYKRYRRETLALLELTINEKSFLVLNGQTGVGKTAIIHECIARGLPALDCEGYARHRGSLFGGMAQQREPATQQEFENQLVFACARLYAAPTLLCEIEGAIGPVVLPQAMQRKLRASPMVYIEADLETRVAHLVETYAQEWGPKQEQEFAAALAQCQRFLSKEQLAEITHAIAQKDFARATRILLQERYDKAYKKGLDKHRERCLATFYLPGQREELLAYLEKITSTHRNR